VQEQWKTCKFLSIGSLHVVSITRAFPCVSLSEIKSLPCEKNTGQRPFGTRQCICDVLTHKSYIAHIGTAKGFCRVFLIYQIYLACVFVVSSAYKSTKRFHVDWRRLCFLTPSAKSNCNKKKLMSETRPHRRSRHSGHSPSLSRRSRPPCRATVIQSHIFVLPRAPQYTSISSARSSHGRVPRVWPRIGAG
jgi:hypothetical protein